jgi:hypothetical protein
VEFELLPSPSPAILLTLDLFSLTSKSHVLIQWYDADAVIVSMYLAHFGEHSTERWQRLMHIIHFHLHHQQMELVLFRMCYIELCATYACFALRFNQYYSIKMLRIWPGSQLGCIPQRAGGMPSFLLFSSLLGNLPKTKFKGGLR